MSTVSSGAVGAALAVVAAGFYFMGSGRSLDYDSSVTVGAFVKTPSLIDPLRRQIQLSNHPLFSVLEHIVWSAGFHSETYLRVLPIVFGALTVALVTAWCAHQWGFVAGAGAGAVLAANPLFAELAREVRGYSLLAFCAVASTLLFWRLLEASPAHRLVEPAYVLFVAAGISTHLYGCVVLLVHAAIVVGRGRLDRVWVRRWVIGTFLGGLIYLKTANNILHTKNDRVFRSGSGREVVLALLGQARIAVLLLGIVVAGALWLARGRKDVLSGVAAVAVFVVIVWVVLQPQFLYTRFLVWLVPGVALAVGFFLSRRPVAVVLVVVAVAAMVIHERSTWTATQVPTAEAAALVDAARADGMRVCGYMHTGVAVLAYTRQPATRAQTAREMAGCDLVLGFYVPSDVDRAETKAFPYAWKVPGQVPGYVYSRRSPAAVTAGMTRRRDNLETHSLTWPS